MLHHRGHVVTKISKFTKPDQVTDTDFSSATVTTRIALRQFRCPCGNELASAHSMTTCHLHKHATGTVSMSYETLNPSARWAPLTGVTHRCLTRSCISRHILKD